MAWRRIPDEVCGLFFALAKARGGDQAPLEAWNRTAFPVLVRAIGSEDRAATVVSKAFEFLCRGGTVQNELAWIARVASNEEIDERRARKGLSLSDQHEPEAHGASSVEVDQEEQEVWESLRTALLALPSPYREAMLLLYVEAWPRHEVIGYLMRVRGIHESGARQILLRGRAMVLRAVRRARCDPPSRP